jgi:hypothetical protein
MVRAPPAGDEQPFARQLSSLCVKLIVAISIAVARAGTRG